jgi:hypothetical protein
MLPLGYVMDRILMVRINKVDEDMMLAFHFMGKPIFPPKIELEQDNCRGYTVRIVPRQKGLS